MRAGIGACIGLLVAGLFVFSATVDLDLGLYLVAPFGATSVLLFAVPNSPLAQPWSAIVGNTSGAVVAVAVCLVIPDPTLRIALAVGLAIAVTMLLRALHPPAGAVAMTAAMSPDTINELGFMFALTPIALGTLILVAIAIIYGRLTHRHYPFRQFDDPNTHGTSDPLPVERLGLSEVELTNILDRYRQSFNLGVEDLARLIGAAEMQAASNNAGAMTTADIMSHDLVTIRPDTSLTEISDLFSIHRFTSLPVVQDDGRFVGVIFQIHLITCAGNSSNTLLAADIMSSNGPRVTPETPVAALLPLMADGEVDAVPVLVGDAIVGIVTRTDLMVALARISLR